LHLSNEGINGKIFSAAGFQKMIGQRIQWIESCPSTNDVARELAIAGEEEGTVIIAQEQTKGKGRKGRSWYSPKKMGLYASVILRPPKSEVSLIPLLAGLAVREAILETIGVEVRLKWPNDLTWEGQKLGGILCESGFLGNRLSFVILGIGLNIKHNLEDFPPEMRPLATSLKIIKKEDIALNDLFPRLWQALDDWYAFLVEGHEQKIIDSFLENSALSLGEEITVVTDKGALTGIFRGIDAYGGLILEEKGKKKNFFSAEIEAIKYP